MPYQVWLYETAGGHCDIRDFLDGLRSIGRDRKTGESDATKCEASIGLLKKHGRELHRPQAAHVKGEIHELRPRGKNVQYRMLYAKLNGDAYLICNIFPKKQPQVPPAKISEAEQRLGDHKERARNADV